MLNHKYFFFCWDTFWHLYFTCTYMYKLIKLCKHNNINFVNSVVSCDILHHKEVYGVNSGKGRSSTPNYFKTTVHMFKIIQDFFYI